MFWGRAKLKFNKLFSFVLEHFVVDIKHKHIHKLATLVVVDWVIAIAFSPTPPGV